MMKWGWCSTITIKIRIKIFPYFHTHPVTSRFTSLVKIYYVETIIGILRQSISSENPFEMLARFFLFFQCFFQLIRIQLYALSCITTFLLG